MLHPRSALLFCSLCMAAAAVSAQQADADNAASLTPLIRVEPSYPPAAQTLGIEGSVELSFSVDANGNVSDVEVVSANPAKIFDAAAIEAVSRWRYPASPDRAPQKMTASVDFTVADYIRSLAAAPSPEQSRQQTGPLNQCVHELASFNYGGVIEVELANACADALFVFGCAEGTGRDRGRWVCAHSEEQQRLLVNQNDQRVGDVTTLADDGQTAYRYEQSFFLMRAPNTEYWWVACRPSDIDCRSAAGQWTRSLDRQTASINPQARASLPLGRSL
jgi:periplasmic protein TonB